MRARARRVKAKKLSAVKGDGTPVASPDQTLKRVISSGAMGNRSNSLTRGGSLKRSPSMDKGPNATQGPASRGASAPRGGGSVKRGELVGKATPSQGGGGDGALSTFHTYGGTGPLWFLPDAVAPWREDLGEMPVSRQKAALRRAIIQKNIDDRKHGRNTKTLGTSI